MAWRFAADAALVVHFAFIVFIVTGGFLARRSARVRALHLASVGYGATITTVGFTCPLTPLEKALRRAAGDAGYEGSFIEHYLLGLIYPGGLDSTVRAAMVLTLAAVLTASYGPAVRRLVLGVECGHEAPAGRLLRPGSSVSTARIRRICAHWAADGATPPASAASQCAFSAGERGQHRPANMGRTGQPKWSESPIGWAAGSAVGLHVTDDDRTDRRLDAHRRLDAALTALIAHTATATADPASVRCLAVAVVNRCDQLVMLDTFEAADAHADDAFDRFMAGDDRRDDVAELIEFTS